MKNNLNFASEIEKSLQGREEEIQKEIAKPTQKEEPLKKKGSSKAPAVELNLIRKPSGLAHSRSFYLRDDTYERLRTFAEENETSVSEVVSKLIERVLP